jgi:methylated-DNA-[protein]-cysteine S-methyltransferase
VERENRNQNMVFETLFGYCAVLYRENPFTFVRVFLPVDKKDQFKKMVPKEVWGISGFHLHAKAISSDIIDYFAGKIRGIKTRQWDIFDMRHLTPLHQQVLRITSDIHYGQVCSYKEIAKTLNRPRAYRFVGSCLAKNPFPIIIPCHRVVRNDLSIGKYGGGSEMKKKMIELEARLTFEYMTCKQ